MNDEDHEQYIKGTNKLKIKLGQLFGTRCKHCGSVLEEYGYNFHTGCFNKSCPEARNYKGGK